MENSAARADTEGVRPRARILIGVTAAIVATAPGCLWTPKPYANDPFVRQRKAILGDPSRPVCLPAHDEPQPPVFPEAPAP